MTSFVNVFLTKCSLFLIGTRLVGCCSISVWNGSTFYFDKFASSYEKQLEELTSKLAENIVEVFFPSFLDLCAVLPSPQKCCPTTFFYSFRILLLLPFYFYIR